jgi:hypothetical protein
MVAPVKAFLNLMMKLMDPVAAHQRTIIEMALGLKISDVMRFEINSPNSLFVFYREGNATFYKEIRATPYQNALIVEHCMRENLDIRLCYAVKVRKGRDLRIASAA